MKNWFRAIGASFSGSDIFVAVYLFAMIAISKSAVYANVFDCNLNGWLYFFASAVFMWMLWVVPMLLIPRQARFFFCPVLCVWTLLNIALLFSRINFAIQLDGDLVGIVLGSSFDEMKWFVGNYFGIKFIVLFLIFLLIVFWIVKITIQGRYAVVNRFRVCTGGVVLAIFIVGHTHFLPPLWIKPVAFFDSIPAIFLLSDSYRSFGKFDKLVQLKKQPVLPQTLMRAVKEDRSFGVIVFGESATRNHWGLYGYGRDTTPELNKRSCELFRFDDLVSSAPNTAENLRYVFTQANLENAYMNCTIAQVLSKAGYHTALYTHQERWGRWESMESFAFAGCDSQTYMNEVGLPSPHYDDSLLSYLRRDFEDNRNTNSVCFLHFTGSHMPADSRYPHEGAPFEAYEYKRAREYQNMEKALGHYDNSIWYSDRVLGEVINICESTRLPAWVIYLSDHGETPNADSWRKADDNDLWEIPMVVWFSKQYRERYPEIVAKVERASKLPLQSDQLYWGILEIAGVDCDEIRSSKNFLSTDFVPRSNRKIGKRIYSR